MASLLKQRVIQILLSIKDYAKIISIYGSYSGTNVGIITPKSDIDFIVIFKNESNPYFISSIIEKELITNNINYDYNWYIEDYFFSLLNQNIDLYLWKSVFLEGEVIFDDSNFLALIKSKFKDIDLEDDFISTYNFRKKHINKNIKTWARNLSRILFDYIGKLYCEKKNITDWSSVPQNRELIKISYEQDIIRKDIYCSFQRLREISKISLEEMDKNRTEIIKELSNLDSKILHFVKL